MFTEEKKINYKIAIVAEGKYANQEIWQDDAWLRAELRQRGHEVDIIDWRQDAHCNSLTGYDAIFISTTWKFIEDPDDFKSWLENCENDGQKRLINDSKLLMDGIRKYDYLLDLIAKFHELDCSELIIPTRFFAEEPTREGITKLSASDAKLDDLLGELYKDPLWRGESIVIKPVTSADGKNTFLYDCYYDESKKAKSIVTNYPQDVFRKQDPVDVDKINNKFKAILADENSNGVILQVYSEGVEKGEYSLTFFNDELSHAIQKPGGFKADNSLARRYVPKHQLPSDMTDFARFLIDYLKEKYGEGSVTRSRIDLFQGEKGPVLSELEFIEPNTNIRIVELDAGVQERERVISKFADAILARVDQLKANCVRV